MNYSQTLNHVINGQDLSFDAMQNLMHQVMAGELTSVQIAGILVALRIKGETVDEIAAAASVMRELSAKVSIQDSTHLIDTCGTGGDGIQTFNVSTVSAFVAAAAGAKVAKHGGRSVSSTCGSADVLEVLGVNVNQTPEQVANCVNEIGLGFMFAPNHHSAMKHAAPVRRELGVRTLFNLLGPLTNPANAKRQVMGVFSAALTGKLAHVLKQLGNEHVLVVCGADGMDEISFTGDTYVAELKDGKVSEYTLNPNQFGLGLHELASIKVSDAHASKAMILDVLSGKTGAAREIVLLNSGAAIYVSGIASSLQAGIAIAADMLDNGKAMQKLQQLIAKTNA
ncbi:MAG: anthranilate phosphoribosyltransferase [Methylotenera sp.]|nr:anthranilate phosphoribosyltransferase [Methylotenera sp.]MDP1754457.1 anthranilate phosphoribosyltransferase [Methylotenera sp.]MDP1960272.1 anthranilate phosphoribosyltransferase [Methylotenera sp.]MDP3206503.1 anthranilate phosphoribosyltransferase [Methylotenera sp.]MDP3303910.1 anthranilate phosphoribosyltransferase [Methylotenera sp.]